MSPQAPIFFRLAMSGSSSLFCSSDASRPTSVENVLNAGSLDAARIHSMQAWILQLCLAEVSGLTREPISLGF